MFSNLNLSRCVTKSNRTAIQRYMLTTGILDENGNIIPLWDENLEFKEHSDKQFNELCYNSKNYSRHYIVDCFFDLETRQIMRTIDEIEVKDNNYNIGDDILVRTPAFSSKVKRSKIVDVIFELDFITAYSGREIYLKNYDKYREDILIDENLFYTVKYYTTKYQIEDGSIVTNYNIFTEVF